MVCTCILHLWSSIVIGNWFILWGREELEALGHERCQLFIIGDDFIQDLLDGCAKLRKGRVVIRVYPDLR